MRVQGAGTNEFKKSYWSKALNWSQGLLMRALFATLFHPDFHISLKSHKLGPKLRRRGGNWVSFGGSAYLAYTPSLNT